MEIQCILLVLIRQIPKLENRVFYKNLFVYNSCCNWGGLGVSWVSLRGIRNVSVELWQDLVLHGIKKSTFQHLTVNWNLNVLEMTLKTSHSVRAYPGHLYDLFLDVSPT